MWELLKRLGSDCWGNHEWISRSNAHGLWLECRHCGCESNGVELPPARYRRTQEGAEEAHRLGGLAPALQAARTRTTTAAAALRFGARRTASGPSDAGATRVWDAATSSPVVVTTDAERRWLQAWRALSPEDRAIAERLVAGLHRAAPVRGGVEDERHERRSTGRLVG